jgi:hypothetical protein
MSPKDTRMASSLKPAEQDFYDDYSAADSVLNLDFSTNTSSTMQDFLSDEEQLPRPSQTPNSDSPALQGEARPLLVAPAPLGPRNTAFFLDHTRRLAITHYQTDHRHTVPAAATAPQFLLQLYIRSNASMFDTRDNLKTILGWCEKLLVLPAINHLLHELGLSGTSMRLEMYDGLDSFKASLALSTHCSQAENIDFFQAIIDHSRNEREHRNMYIEYLDCEKELRLAHLNVQHGNLALHPANHPRVGGRLYRGQQLQNLVRDIEAAKRHPNAWTRPPNVITTEQTAVSAHRPQLSASMPPPPFPARTVLAQQEAAGPTTQPPSSAVQALSQAVSAAASSAFQPILPASSRNVPAPRSPTPGTLLSASSAQLPLNTKASRSPSPSAGSTRGRPPSASVPSSAPFAPAPPIATRVAKPGSPLNPLERSTTPIAPASFFLAPYQPYHHAAIVIDELAWQRRGLVVLKFDKEKDWTESADAVGSLDEGDYVAERVSCFKDGRVEQRATERNMPEGMKMVRFGEVELGEEMEVVSKRWLGDVLVEIVKGGYVAHLGQ